MKLNFAFSHSFFQKWSSRCHLLKRDLLLSTCYAIHKSFCADIRYCFDVML